MTQQNPPALLVALMAAGLTTTIGISSATAEPPEVRHAVADSQSSGYVMPAGIVPYAVYQGGVVPVTYQCDAIDGSFYTPGGSAAPPHSGNAYAPAPSGNNYAPGGGNVYEPGTGSVYDPNTGGTYAPVPGNSVPGNSYAQGNNNYNNDRGTGLFDNRMGEPLRDECQDPCDRCGGGGLWDRGLFKRWFGGKEPCPECEPADPCPTPCPPNTGGFFGQPGCEPCAPGSGGYYGQPGMDPCAPSYYGQPSPCPPGGPCGPCGPGPCGPNCPPSGPFGGLFAPGSGGYGPNGYPCDPCDPCAPGYGRNQGRNLGSGLNNALSDLRRFCLFCRGGGCSVCQSLKSGNLRSMLGSLRPFGGDGFCTMRWYDISAEVTFLTHSNGGLSGPVTSLGVSGPIVLDLGSPDGGNDFEPGARVSAAFICGPGGNVEATWMGGNQWRNQAAAADAGGGLYSFVSDFGTNPGGGYDDTDRSIFQSLTSESEYDSLELNYRRRTVGPYCRFQSSWLLGLRYVRYQDGLLYSTLGDAAGTRYFSSSDTVKNNIWGPQIGLDVWWHVLAGLRVGVGIKGAWVRNDLDRRTQLTANSLASSTIIDGSDHQTTIMADLEAKVIYRINHSWALRGAYYLTAIDEVAFGTADANTIGDFVSAVSPVAQPAYHLNSLTTQGFAFGAEYRW